MTNWIIDEQWLDDSNSWFLPPAPQIISKKSQSPLHAFNDYIYPTADRLVQKKKHNS